LLHVFPLWKPPPPPPVHKRPLDPPPSFPSRRHKP
jgi:hypothetical protein